MGCCTLGLGEVAELESCLATCCTKRNLNAFWAVSRMVAWLAAQALFAASYKGTEQAVSHSSLSSGVTVLKSTHNKHQQTSHFNLYPISI